MKQAMTVDYRYDSENEQPRFSADFEFWIPKKILVVLFLQGLEFEMDKSNVKVFLKTHFEYANEPEWV